MLFKADYPWILRIWGDQKGVYLEARKAKNAQWMAYVLDNVVSKNIGEFIVGPHPPTQPDIEPGNGSEHFPGAPINILI